MLVHGLLHGKHVKGRTVMHDRTSIPVAVWPMLGTVPSMRAIPCKVVRHVKAYCTSNI
jgi:hypothetical protein